MSEIKPLIDFDVDLKATPKPKPSEIDSNENWGRSVERKKPGRKKTKRTAQIHPRLPPEIADEFNAIAEERDITAGALFEEIFQFWKLNTDYNQK